MIFKKFTVQYNFKLILIKQFNTIELYYSIYLIVK